MKAKKQDVWAVAGKAFPNYSGRKFKVSLAGVFTAYDTNWGGGTRNQYVAVPLFDGRPSVLDVPAPWLNQVEGKTVTIPQGFAVVEHSIFQGHDMGLTIHVNTQDMAKVLTNGIA